MKKGAIQIGRNESCPCGSGKRYMDCCLNRKYLINYNYKDKAVMVDKKQTFENFKEIIALNKWLNQLKRLKEKDIEMTLEDGFKTLSKTYSLLNKALKEVENFTSCKKGCSACCSGDIDITYMEGQHIKRYLKNKFKSDEVNNIKNKVKTKEQRNKCLFLSNENGCIIYEARPVKCRTHLVFSHPSACDSNEDAQPLEYSDAILSLVENTVYKISKLVLEKEEQTKSLFEWFYDEYK